MKILHTVEFYQPWIGGLPEVVKQISERLVKAGHEVTVATTKLLERQELLINGVNIQEFKISGNEVTGLLGEVEHYQNFLLSSDFDIITNFGCQQWQTDIMLPLLQRIKAKKVFVPTGFTFFYKPEYQNYYQSMRQWIHEYDMNVFLSNDYWDINFARNCGVQDLVVIPNGASEEEFRTTLNVNIRERLGIPRDNFLILHVGSHTGIKGHSELIKMFVMARNLKQTTLLIVGNELKVGCSRSCKAKEKLWRLLPSWVCNKNQLIIADLTRVQTVAAYQSADLFVFPSNIECSPLVLFECMASKTPFLATDVGNISEIIHWSKGGKLLPTQKLINGYGKAKIHESIKVLEQIVQSPDERQAMAETSYEVWSKQFTWRAIASRYEELYLQLLQN